MINRPGLTYCNVLKSLIVLIFILISVCLPACSDNAVKVDEEDNSDSQPAANVLSVRVTGSEQAYQFSVEIRSDDTGCDQYAAWWEVIAADSTLLYRRILTHSHVNEQPFTRSGGPVAINADDIVYVRAHMHPAGYGRTVYRGSVADGFQETIVAADFAATLENQAPQPGNCAF